MEASPLESLLRQVDVEASMWAQPSEQGVSWEYALRDNVLYIKVELPSRDDLEKERRIASGAEPVVVVEAPRRSFNGRCSIRTSNIKELVCEVLLEISLDTSMDDEGLNQQSVDREIHSKSTAVWMLPRVSAEHRGILLLCCSYSDMQSSTQEESEPSAYFTGSYGDLRIIFEVTERRLLSLADRAKFAFHHTLLRSLPGFSNRTSQASGTPAASDEVNAPHVPNTGDAPAPASSVRPRGYGASESPREMAMLAKLKRSSEAVQDHPQVSASSSASGSVHSERMGMSGPLYSLSGNAPGYGYPGTMHYPPPSQSAHVSSYSELEDEFLKTGPTAPQYYADTRIQAPPPPPPPPPPARTSPSLPVSRLGPTISKAGKSKAVPGRVLRSPSRKAPEGPAAAGNECICGCFLRNAESSAALVELVTKDMELLEQENEYLRVELKMKRDADGERAVEEIARELRQENARLREKLTERSARVTKSKEVERLRREIAHLQEKVRQLENQSERKDSAPVSPEGAEHREAVKRRTNMALRTIQNQMDGLQKLLGPF
ncbi:hypothetical protein FVE85_9191 [Porphyridium purpureum]|uniref:Uncharacterized protein n=1 Tax=Porphyridium purpureum TaxID=35688 RepID=A0A5J4YN90_PORPP|nr:hypothetical protein FVE85_9191 [Porphyridium purpureum]|eukprot:POR7458..scf222_8